MPATDKEQATSGTAQCDNLFILSLTEWFYFMTANITMKGLLVHSGLVQYSLKVFI